MWGASVAKSMQKSPRVFGIVCVLIGVLIVVSGCVDVGPFGAPTTIPSTPTPIPPPKVVTYSPAISAGYFHDLALCRNGTVIGWLIASDGDWGQADVPPGLTNVTAIAAGGYHSMALLENHTVVQWDSYGLHLGEPFGPPPGLTNVTAISAGRGYSLALLDNGSVVSWGHNEWGTRDVPPGLRNVTAIAAGHTSAMALLDNGSVVIWGNALGDFKYSVWTGLTDAKAIVAGGSHIALLQNGTFVNIYDGQLLIAPGEKPYLTAISAGSGSFMTLDEDDTVSYSGTGRDKNGVLCPPSVFSVK